MTINSFNKIPETGVIKMMSMARNSGFFYGNSEWAYLGQGAPELGQLEGGIDRILNIEAPDRLCEYAPSAGLPDLRAAVAELYNNRYRKGLGSRYSAENVCIVAGGRLALSRICAAMNNIHLGHVLPDYTAYSELLSCFGNIFPIPIPLRELDGFQLSPARMRSEVVDRGLGAFLLSNPCNPTGQAASGKDVEAWIGIANENQCTLILDEFYSHYLYGESARADGPSLSGARYISNVNKDPVLLIDGITKNWRYPGFRVSWVVGPKDFIKRLGSIGSFLDGGAPKPIQQAIIPIIDQDLADKEALAIQSCFSKKRDLLIKGFSELGLKIYNKPSGAFYFFVSLENLPERLSDGHAFAKKAMEHKTIVIPGEYFDVNPGRRRSHIDSRLKKYIRVSYGPNIETIKLGINNFKNILSNI